MNKHDRAEYQREYYKRNKEKIAIRKKERYNDQKEYYKNYRKNYKKILDENKTYLGAYIDKGLAEVLKRELKESGLSFTQFLTVSIRAYLGRVR